MNFILMLKFSLQRKEITPGGVAGLQTQLVALRVAGWVRLPLLSAMLIERITRLPSLFE